ncbi:MAG: hypothetical protein KJN92_05455, partial [Gemmatimonadetes bacterium]|nr:hypothetical protein [Gemmatimonadota bacterium]
MRSSRRRIGALVLLASLGFGVFGAGWLTLSTEWGMRTVWNQVQIRFPAGLRVDEVKGRLRGPMEFRGLTFEGDRATVRVDRVRLAPRLLPLLRGTFFVQWLEVEDVDVALVAATPDAEAEPPSPLPSLALPLKLVLEEAVARRISLNTGRDGVPERRLDSLWAESLSFQDRLEFPDLNLDGPEGRIAVSGWVQTQGAYPFEAQVEGALDRPDQSPVEGRLILSGNPEAARVQGVVTAPMDAEFLVILTDPRGEQRFEMELTFPDADAQQIRPE